MLYNIGLISVTQQHELSINSVQFSRLVVSDSLLPQGPQHARPPCPSPTPSLLKRRSIESVMPSNHLTLCRPYKRTYVWDSPGGASGKKKNNNNNNACQMLRDKGSIPGWGRSPGGGHGSLLRYPSLENPMDRGAWRATVHGVTKSRTRLSEHTHKYIPWVLKPTSMFIYQLIFQQKLCGQKGMAGYL